VSRPASASLIERVPHSAELANAECRVAIVDYGLGNLFSLQQACAVSGLRAVATSEHRAILDADAVILPGIGAFGDAMRSMESCGLPDVLREVAESGTMLIGICLGMQLLMDASHEFGFHQGLGIIPGTVLPLREPELPPVRLPHVCWNQLDRQDCVQWKNALLADVDDGASMYFVHSYKVVPRDQAAIAATTNYESSTFCSVISQSNVIGFQCHPERSARTGLKVFGNLRERLMVSRESQK
jgi:glutamine amidotransferase